MECWSCDHEVELGRPFWSNCGSPLRIGVYTILSRLGIGASSQVYHAVHESSGKEVAIKRFTMEDSGAAVQALREIEILQTIRHKNIVRMIDADVERGYAVLEYVPGETLEELIETQPHTVSANFTEWMIQVCEALRTLHRHLIIHRDLNPKHILIAHDGAARVIDFGVSKVLEVGQTGRTNVGHPAYTAPEVQKESPYDHRADIYSLGAIFYEIWTGRPPVVASTPFSYQLQATQHSFPPASRLNSETPGELSDLIEEMLEVSQERRVQSIDWVLAELRGPEVPGDENITIDDVQHMLARIYGHKNRELDTEQLLNRLFTSISAVVSELRRSAPRTGNARIKHYLARGFAWLCAGAGSLNWRMSEIIALKYGTDRCPYCDKPVCQCSLGGMVERRVTIDLDTAYQQALSAADTSPALSISDYQSRFRRIYGARNAAVGPNDVGVHFFLELGEVFDDLHRIKALLRRKRISMLHLELSDLAAWYFALANFYDDSFDLQAMVLNTFPGECYRCHQPVCQCIAEDSEIRQDDWQ